MKKISRSAILGHSARTVYALVEDVEAYPRFLPWCAGAQVHFRTPEVTRATLTLGMAGVRQSLTTENRNRPDEAIDMRQVEGPFRHFGAEWRFSPLGERGCKVQFTMRYQFASRAIGALLEPMFDRIASGMVDAFSKRADEVDAAPSG